MSRYHQSQSGQSSIPGHVRGRLWFFLMEKLVEKWRACRVSLVDSTRFSLGMMTLGCCFLADGLPEEAWRWNSALQRGECNWAWRWWWVLCPGLAHCPLNSVHALWCRTCITHSYVTTTVNEIAGELSAFLLPHILGGMCLHSGAYVCHERGQYVIGPPLGYSGWW